MMRLAHLKSHRRSTYTTLLTEGRLNKYLHEIDEQANEILNLLVSQMSVQENITETLKATNPMEWLQEMNNIRNRAEEIVLREVVYNHIKND